MSECLDNEVPCLTRLSEFRVTLSPHFQSIDSGKTNVILPSVEFKFSILAENLKIRCIDIDVF